jgi:hypothetical protein
METERARWAEVVAEVVEGTPLEVVSVTSYPYEEPPAGEGMTVNSRFFDAAGAQLFALVTLLRRKGDV